MLVILVGFVALLSVAWLIERQFEIDKEIREWENYE